MTMAIKVVSILADKGGTLARQEANMAKAKADLQALVTKATRTISVNTKEDESKFEFIAVVDLPEEEKKDDKGAKPTSRKEK
jgi:hypothetical protein